MLTTEIKLSSRLSICVSYSPNEPHVNILGGQPVFFILNSHTPQNISNNLGGGGLVLV